MWIQHPPRSPHVEGLQGTAAESPRVPALVPMTHRWPSQVLEATCHPTASPDHPLFSFLIGHKRRNPNFGCIDWVLPYWPLGANPGQRQETHGATCPEPQAGWTLESPPLVLNTRRSYSRFRPCLVAGSLFSSKADTSHVVGPSLPRLCPLTHPSLSCNVGVPGCPLLRYKNIFLSFSSPSNK